jgi:hypothetical protein
MYKFVAWKEDGEDGEERYSISFESRSEAADVFRKFVRTLDVLDNAAARVEDQEGRILFSVTYFNQTW